VRASTGIALWVLMFCSGQLCAAVQEPAAPPQPQQQPSAATAPQTQAPSAAPAPFQITGLVHTGKLALPGVTVTAANTLTGKKFSTTTDTDGTFSFTLRDRGRYVVRAEFLGFAPETQEVLLNPQNPAVKVEIEIQLASRVEELREQQQAARAAGGAVAAGRGFQNLAAGGAMPSLAALAGAGEGAGGGELGGANGGDLSALPFAGAGADAATESVVSGGGMGQSQNFGGLSDEQIQQRIQEFRQSMGGGPGGGQFGGGPGGGGGFGGPGGGGGIIRAGRGFNINQPHGTLYFTDDNAFFDASPYALNGEPTPKASYNQARFGATVGGPLNIPKIYHGGTKTFFFVNYNGSRASNPYDAFSIVPTMAERQGDFSAALLPDKMPVEIYAPTGLPAGCPIAPGQQFSALVNGVMTPNAIPSSCISPAAAKATAALLSFIPMPNLTMPGSPLNFHYVASGQSDTDSINVRLIHNFGASGGGPGNVLFGPGGGTAGPGGGRGGGRRQQGQNINFVLNFTRGNIQNLAPFPSLNGTTNTQGLNAGAGYAYNHGRLFNQVRFNYNHLHSATSNLYAFVDNIIGTAGITGVSDEPFDFGLPQLRFNDLSGLSDPSARRVLNQTYTLSDTLGWSHKKHTFRFGGDYRRILEGLRSDQNARGTFTFTGFATQQMAGGVPVSNTGFDFADFLLGIAQSTSVQGGASQTGALTFGNSAYNFRANSYDFFAQDEWKARSNFTINAGLRYEYQGPYTEVDGRIVNLDVAPGFTVVAPVCASSVVGALCSGLTGPYTGGFPASLLQPDRNAWAPRIGLAWKPVTKMVVRSGYGINYNLAQYGSIIQNLAFQPPFAITATNTQITCSGVTLTLTDGFSSCPITGVTNTYAVDKNYRLGYVQLWNLDVQYELPGDTVMNIGYNGSKGTRLDLVEAPNSTATGVRITGVQPFLFESSDGNSIYHGLSVRVRRRLRGGISVNGQYTYSKSIDDASSIGGGASVVAQNAFNLAAERGLSSFDQRHKFTGTWIYELPFGNGKKYLQTGRAAHILGGWLWSGDFTIASGTPLTPRIVGGFGEVNAGVSGELRPNIVPGIPISVPNPSIAEWFNPKAFCNQSVVATCTNPTGSPYGDAGRNIIEGPGQLTFDMNISKTFQIRETRSLELRAGATNIFNHVQYVTVDTNINSPTFGQVIAAGTMRRVTFTSRFRF